jgi:hypothetical protein
VPPGTAAHVEHSPVWLYRDGLGNERDGPLRIGLITMRVEPKIVLAEPFFEPFGHVS